MCGCGLTVPIASKNILRLGWIKGQPNRFIYGHSGVQGQPNDFEHRPDGTTVLFLNYKGEMEECVIWTQDYEKVKGYHWIAALSSKNHGLYVRTNGLRDGHNQGIRIHQLLIPDSQHVDHKNHDGLDNRVYDPVLDIGNIRPATATQNQRNRIKSQRQKFSSQFKGVCWEKATQSWRAQITTGEIPRPNLGRFTSEEDAARAYDAAAIKYFGEFALLNFPPTAPEVLAEQTVGANF
jgi:hypothetical protein